MIIHWLLTYTSMKHSLLLLKLLALTLNSLDTLSDIRIKHLRFSFNQYIVYYKHKHASPSVVNNF